MRHELIKIDADIENLQELNIELSKLVYFCNKFYNACILKNDLKRNLFKLSEAKSHLLTCFNILKNIIDQENNKLIEDFKNTNPNVPEDLDKHFENFLSGIDINQKQLIKDIQNSSDNLIGDLTLPSSIKNFMEELKDGMENVVLYPLTMSLKIYREKNVEKMETDCSKKELFKFILFRCILISAKIKGSEKRQKASLSSMSSGTNITEIKNIRQGRPIIKTHENKGEEEIKEEVDDFDELFA
jgi:hypothetical protein